MMIQTDPKILKREWCFQKNKQKQKQIGLAQVNV